MPFRITATLERIRETEEMALTSGSLFDEDFPDGFRYQADLITSDEERSLLEDIGTIEFSTFEMRGVVARRRVAFFGKSYDAIERSPELPPFLMPLRDKVARWTQIESSAFVMALINEYQPGAPIGWHRDAPQYEIVAGVSLLSSCRMKFRPYVSPSARESSGRRRTATHDVFLDRRSAYVMTRAARHACEHHIPAVSQLRYSVTFRTLRK